MGLEELGANMQGPWLVLALSAFGLLVGVLTGLFGVGGGFLVVPLLNILFGLDYRLAVGSSLCFMIGASISGAARHARLRNIEPRCTLVLAGASMLAAWVGGLINDALRTTYGGAYSKVMHALFVGILAVTAAVVYRGSGTSARKLSLLQRLPLGPRIDLPVAGRPGVSLPGLLAAGGLIGLTTGMMGIGGGVLFMPLLVLLVGLTPHQAVGTSLGVIVFSSIVGTVKYALVDSVSLVVAMSLLVGAAIGAQAGAAIGERLQGPNLRRGFSGVLAVVILLLVADLLRKALS